MVAIQSVKSGFVWEVPPDIFVKNWVKWSLRLDGKAFALFSYRAAEMEQYMKANAPWHDRTGAARAALRVSVTRSVLNAIEMVLYYDNIPYDKWLETIQNGTWGIISPTIQVYQPILSADMKGLMR